MGDFKSRKFVYGNSLKWTGQKKGLLTSADKQSFEVATPPEFRGHPGIWSPEDLWVGSVNACIMTTFLFFMEKEEIKLLSYESHAEGILERVEGRFMFSEVIVKPGVQIERKEDVERVKNIFLLSENRCLISNSVKSKVVIIPEIEVAGV